MLKAHLIDPFAETVTEIDLPEDLSTRMSDTYRLLDCDLIDAARLDDGHAVYVNDEGLYVNNQRFFLVDDYPHPLAGKGLFVGPVGQEGDTTSATRAPAVRFLGDKDNVRLWLIASSQEARAQ